MTNLCKSVSDERREELLVSLANAVGVPPDLPVPMHHRPMTWDQARDLERRGVRFGSHSVSHRLFSRLSDAAAEVELMESRRRVQQEFEHPLPILAWPIGRRADFGGRDLDLAARTGYAAAVDVYTEDHVPGVGSRRNHIPLLHRHGFVDNPRAALRMLLGFPRSAAKGTARPSGRPIPVDHADSTLDWSRVKRLVFVCKGNICRSPYAEARARIARVEAISCGITAAPGAAADPSALRNGFLRDVDLSSHRSRRLDQVELDAADLLVTMDDGQRTQAADAASRSGAQWTRAASWVSLYNGVDRIADPFGRDDVDFQRAFELIDDVVACMAQELAFVRHGPAQAG